MLDLGGVHTQNLTIYSLANSSWRQWFEQNAKVKLIMTMLALVGLPMDLIRGNLDTASEKKPLHSYGYCSVALEAKKVYFLGVLSAKSSGWFPHCAAH